MFVTTNLQLLTFAEIKLWKTKAVFSEQVLANHVRCPRIKRRCQNIHALLVKRLNADERPQLGTERKLLYFCLVKSNVF